MSNRKFESELSSLNNEPVSYTTNIPALFSHMLGKIVRYDLDYYNEKF